MQEEKLEKKEEKIVSINQEIKKAENKEEGAGERQLVIFKLGTEEFGVNIQEIKEINRLEKITKIPNSQDYIKGVINLRGGIIVIIDLAMKLGLPSKENDKNTRVIIVEIRGNTVGMIVDSATEVIRLNSENIKPAPKVITQKIQSNYIEGVGVLGERLLILLDLTKVLETKELEDVKTIGKEAQVE